MNLTPTPMEISSHAIERWAQRVRQDDGMRPTSARADMQRCAQTGTLQSQPPEWMHVYAGLYLDRVEYLMLGDDIAMVVRRVDDGNLLVVITVMTRHDPGGVHAASLRARRLARRAAQHPPPPPGSVFPPRSYDDGWRSGASVEPDDLL